MGVTHGLAQQLIGVHPWNYVSAPDGHQSSAIDGAGLGIVVTTGAARIEDCYVDTMPILINVIGGDLIVTGNLFLKNASIILRSPQWKRPTARTGVKKLIITNKLSAVRTTCSSGRASVVRCYSTK